eukprot:6322589-Pyramimonas_sp.AAC.1
MPSLGSGLRGSYLLCEEPVGATPHFGGGPLPFLGLGALPALLRLPSPHCPSIPTNANQSKAEHCCATPCAAKQ